MTTPAEPTTVTASGIAKMAGVGRAAVSNWRRRHADFPAPVGGTAASPIFSATDVEQWLKQQGKLHSVRTEEWVWRHVESVTPAAAIGEALCVVGAYLLVESWHPSPSTQDDGRTKPLPTPEHLLAHLRSRDEDLADLAGLVLPPRWSAQLEAVLHAAAQLRSEHDAGAAFEYLHDQYANSTRSLSGPDATPTLVAEIMLSVTRRGSSILDFTCGTGSILHAAAEQAHKSGAAIRCLAQELKPRHALTTLLRLWFLHDRAVRAGLPVEPPMVCVGDSLLTDAFPNLTADVVIANPPFGIHDWGHERLAYDPRWAFGLPPRTEPELAWVQHAISHLSPGRTAVLLMPPAAAARPAGRRIRGELVRRGALQAVIALPAGMLPPAAIGLHLWVLTRPAPSAPPGHRLLFVDTAAAAQPRSRARGASAVPVRQTVEKAWRAYLSQGEAAEEPGVYRVVSAVEVLDEEVDLTPRRHLPIGGPVKLDHGKTLVLVRQFGERIDEIRGGLPPVRAVHAAGPDPVSTADIADLLRSGSLSIHRSVNRARGEEGTGEELVEVTVLTGLDVLSSGPPTGTLRRSRDHASIARVKAGDILIPVVAREIMAHVATPAQVGVELGLGVHALRVDPEILDPWFLAGILSTSDNTRVAGGVTKTTAGMMRIDVTRLTVPVLPIGTQRKYGEAFRRLAEFRVALGRAAEQGDALARDIAEGLASGALTIEPG